MRKKIIFVVGPTASGKSTLSYNLARKYKAALINCDSLQVYKGLNIGTAKPTPEELAPYSHYLFDCVELGEEFTAGKFRKYATDILNKSDHRVFVIVGGSGFYIKALTGGMFEEVPVKSEAQRQVLKLKEDLTKIEFHKELAKKDPEYALKIHYNDQYRVSRALELILSLNKTMGQIQREFKEKSQGFEFDHIYLGAHVEREELRQRISTRLNGMLAHGFKGEVEQLLSLGLKNWKPMSSVGYKEMISLIEGQMTEAEFKEEVVKNTMRLAKRQMTWFRANKKIQWYNVLSDNLDPLYKYCNDFL